MKSNIQIWKTFKVQFEAHLRSNHPHGIKSAWRSMKCRTQFYINTIFPAIAAHFNWEHQRELFKVDYAFYKLSSSGDKVPVVFIESENDAGTATHELRKLLSLNAPCRILIVCCEWSTDLWKPGRQDTLMAEWSKLVASHAEVWKINGVIGVINAESGRVFRISTAAWNEAGKLIEPVNILLELPSL